jgi:hypothetical protein
LKEKYRFNTDGKFENFVYYPIISIILISEAAIFVRYILQY